jgi:hypothetical protein
MMTECAIVVCGLGRAGVVPVCSLGTCNIGVSGATAVAAALAHLPQLQELR